MNRRIVLAIGLLTLGAIALWLASSKPQPIEQETEAPPPEAAEPEPTATAPEAEPDDPPHPVSLEALRQKSFNGRDFTVGQVLATEAAYTRYYITYKSGALTISGIMNVPTGDGPFPVLFLNHGYIDPAVYTNGRGLRREQDYLARQGFVVIHSDYRNHAESSDDPNNERLVRLGYVEDVINAVLAVQAADLPYIHKDRIGMLGHSMGGGIAQAIAVTKPDLVDAIVLYAPVSGDAAENFERYTKDRADVVVQLREAYGLPDTNPDFWRGVSPNQDYERWQVPVMIHIGTNDESTPPEWAKTINKKLTELGKPVTFHEYPGEHHEFGPQWGSMMDRTAAFFKDHLR